MGAVRQGQFQCGRGGSPCAGTLAVRVTLTGGGLAFLRIHIYSTRIYYVDFSAFYMGRSDLFNTILSTWSSGAGRVQVQSNWCELDPGLY